MPDAIIRYPDGRTAGLEVVGDHDIAFEQQSAALAKHRTVHVDGLRWDWAISLDHKTKIKKLIAMLPDRLHAAEQTYPDEPARAARLIVEVLDTLGVALFTATASQTGVPGTVSLRSAPFSGWGLSADALTEWVERVLRRESDVGDKLAGAALGVEGHAFIWVTIGSEVPIQTILDSNATALPSDDPTLPRGVTHIWVVSGFQSTRGLAWFPDLGWHELPFRWPDEQPMRLTQTK